MLICGQVFSAQKKGKGFSPNQKAVEDRWFEQLRLWG